MRPLRDNPCYGCVAPKRYPGCHDKCIDYIIAKVFHDAEAEIEHEKQVISSYTSDTTRNNIDRSCKRKRGFRGHYWRHC